MTAIHTCGHLPIPCVACRPIAPPAPAATPLTDAQLDAMEAEARKKIPAAAGGTQWMGPCADSFCFASCEMVHCRYELRIGKTPKEHDAKVDAMIANDPVLILVAQLRAKSRPSPHGQRRVCCNTTYDVQDHAPGCESVGRPCPNCGRPRGDKTGRERCYLC